MVVLQADRFIRAFALVTLSGLFCSSHSWAAERRTLDNGVIQATFEDGALVRLRSTSLNQEVAIVGDSAAFSVDGERFALSGKKPARVGGGRHKLVFNYPWGDRRVEAVYELKPGGHFVCKQLRLILPKDGKCRIGSVEAFSGDLQAPIAREHRAAHNTGAVFLRFGQSEAAATTGMFLVMQNPFLNWSRKEGHVSMAYTPDMEWQAAYGPFESDRACLGLYKLSGVAFPARNLGEWTYVAEPEKAFDNVPKLDWAETNALSRCVRAFVLAPSKKSLNVHVPWCENDYQIDVATPAGRAEWKRIIDQCAAVGVEHTLFTPGNSEVAPLKDNADAWGWENCLWLGLGQKIRKSEWNIAKDPIPPSIQEILDYAKAKNVKLVAYAYPTLGWKQNPEWTAWCQGKTGGYVGADTGVRSFQDWFVDQLVAFHDRTGISGYSFDHWWIAYEPNKEGFKPTSKYAQWHGCRRILEELRRRVPDVVIDGRQQYQWFGPWTWLGGSYPHPTTTDEQPGSFENFPDLHFSRVSADRQRWAAWWYRMEQFTPLDILPGYMTHQTPRNDAKGGCVKDRAFHARDWDYLGWKYSVIASIGTAPFNNVVNLLPARDENELEHFRVEDQRWLRNWLQWTDRNHATLGNLRPIIGPPVFGRIDGTAAIKGDRGFIFLFNPNYRQLNARFMLDASIGLWQEQTFLLRELYPREGRYWGKPGGGLWKHGDKVSLPIKGPEAVVLELVPAAGVDRPILLGAPGKAVIDGDQLKLTDVEGPAGKAIDLSVLVWPNQKVKRVTVNGRPISTVEQRAEILNICVQFAGAAVDHCPQVGECERGFTGRTYRAKCSVPRRVFAQLGQRRQAWSIPYTDEELLATWRGPDRLLLFIHLADPKDSWEVGLKIDGRAVEVKRAYGDVFPLGRDRTFAGFYADVSKLAPEVPHEFEVSLPDGLKPGQFQGLFLENVEAEFTTAIASPSEVKPVGAASAAAGEAVCVVPSPDITQSNPYYPGNRPPLLPSPFIRLPTGSVKPQGWLRKQLELQAQGYIGHMSEVSGNLNKNDNAWLNPSGKGGCFWEEVPYWLRGYVSMAYLLGDPKLIEEARLWLEPSIVGQRANGYFGTEALSGGANNAPDLMPHQNMLYAYRAYYDATGDKRVLDLMTRYFHWELTLDDRKFFNGGWGAARNSDNMDMAYWLYNRTGDPKLLELGEKLMRTGERWMNHLGGCHNVAYCQGFRKPAVFYQQNKDPKYLAQMESNYHDIYDVYGQVPGGMFAGDEFARPGHTDPQQAIETCGAVEMMFSSQILLRITGDLKWMDRCENIAYNTLPATMTADFRGLRYLTSPNQSNSDARGKAPTLADDGPMQVMNPRDHHCCQHNVACAWPYLVESQYQATPDRGLAATMYAPCTVTAKVGDGTKVKIEQATRYPFEEQVELRIACPKRVAFPLYLRVPSWCSSPKVSINGRVADLAAKGGELVKIARTWNDGDKVLLDLPMGVAIARWVKNKNSVSVNRGPLTYSVKIGEKYVRQHPERKDDKWPAHEITPTTPWNYGLVLNEADPASGIEVVKGPFPADEQPFRAEAAPLELKVSAKRIRNWTENYFGVGDRLQPSPIKSSEPLETVSMIPMGCARLRMTALPVIGEGPGAKEWGKCGEPISSWSEDEGILKTLTDPRDPKNSRDGGVGMFLMYSPTIAGSTQWIRMPLGGERTVSRAKTYWWTEFYEHGGVRVPASWKLLYKTADGWKPVSNPKGYGVALDQYNEVTFDPVKTDELRIEIKFQPGRCGSLIRWRVE